MNTVIEPTLDDVLSRGRAAVISIGFLIALWAGSRALNVFVDTITIMYGMGGKRGLVRTRALSFVLYLVFLVAGVVVLPLILAGPTLVNRVLPVGLEFIGSLYWPVVLLGSACMLATLYHLSVPVRTRWRADLPGAAITVAMWVGGSLLLRFVLSQVHRNSDDLWPAGRAHCVPYLALRDFPGRPDRCGVQLRLGRCLSTALRHRP